MVSLCIDKTRKTPVHKLSLFQIKNVHITNFFLVTYH